MYCNTIRVRIGGVNADIILAGDIIAVWYWYQTYKRVLHFQPERYSLRAKRAATLHGRLTQGNPLRSCAWSRRSAPSVHRKSPKMSYTIRYIPGSYLLKLLILLLLPSPFHSIAPCLLIGVVQIRGHIASSSFPPPPYGIVSTCLAFLSREGFNAFLPSSTRVELCLLCLL